MGPLDTKSRAPKRQIPKPPKYPRDARMTKIFCFPLCFVLFFRGRTLHYADSLKSHRYPSSNQQRGKQSTCACLIHYYCCLLQYLAAPLLLAPQSHCSTLLAPPPHKPAPRPLLRARAQRPVTPLLLPLTPPPPSPPPPPPAPPPASLQCV